MENHHKLKVIVLRGFIAAFSICAVLVLVEMALRVWGIDPRTERMVAYQFDSTLGWTTRPDFKYYRSSLYYGQFNYYNPAGLPTDSAHWHVTPSTETPSIAFLGSSFAESYYLPYEESFPYLVGQSFPDTQVLNFGVSGYAPGQYLLRARTEFPRYKIKDIVIIFFPFKDLPGLMSDTYQGYAKPYFRDDLSRPVNVPLVENTPETQKDTIVARVRNTALYTLLRPYVRKSIAINLKTGNKEALLYDAELMGSVMKIFKKIQDENPGARVIVYEIPYYKEMADRTLYDANNATYGEACRIAQMNCLSMEAIIRDHPNADELFILGDGHVTAYGARLIARDIVQELEKKSLPQ